MAAQTDLQRRHPSTNAAACEKAAERRWFSSRLEAIIESGGVHAVATAAL
jgi:hypothetical protein